MEGEDLCNITLYHSTGIVMLLTALFGSARMGIFQVPQSFVKICCIPAILQELLYKEYGKHPREAMFYTVSAH